MVHLRTLDVGYGLTAVGALLLLSFPGTEAWRPWVTPVPVVLLAVSVLLTRDQGWRLLAAGLTIAATADALLAVGGLFVFGMGAFAAMQGLYNLRLWALFQARPRPRRGVLVPTAALGAVAVVLLSICLPQVGTLAVPMGLYAMLLTAMAVGSWAAGRGASLGWGGTLFLLSDSLILVFQVWPAPRPWGNAAILVTYWAAQYLIVRSLRTS